MLFTVVGPCRLSGGKALVRPLAGLGRRPLLTQSWRDPVDEGARRLRHVLADRLEYKTGVPGCMKLAVAFSIHEDLVSAAVALKGHVQRLMDIAHPVAEELQRDKFVDGARSR